MKDKVYLGEKILLGILILVSVMVNVDNHFRLKRMESERVIINMYDCNDQSQIEEIEPTIIEEPIAKKTSQELLNTLDFDLLLEITAQVESDNRNVAPRQVCYSKDNCTIVRGKYQIEDSTAKWMKKLYKVEGDKAIAKQLYIHRLNNESWRLNDSRADWSCEYFVVYKAYFNSYKGATTIERWEKSKAIVMQRRAKNNG